MHHSNSQTYLEIILLTETKNLNKNIRNYM